MSFNCIECMGSLLLCLLTVCCLPVCGSLHNPKYFTNRTLKSVKSDRFLSSLNDFERKAFVPHLTGFKVPLTNEWLSPPFFTLVSVNLVHELNGNAFPVLEDADCKVVLWKFQMQHSLCIIYQKRHRVDKHSSTRTWAAELCVNMLGSDGKLLSRENPL